jgi:Tfp pilus assembly protein PilN
MRPVNLLPESERGRRPVQQANGAYVTLGVLGAALVAALLFVLAQNQINGRTSDISAAQQNAARAETRASQLDAFGNFAQTKQTRVQSVTELANARFDWERFMRELGLVLPEGSSLLDVTASTTGDPATGAAGAPPAPAPAVGDAAAASDKSPTVKLTGCAVSQSRVAVLMLRLRKLYRAQDVDLNESAQEENGTVGAAPGTAAANNTTCPPGKYKFDITVTFAPAPVKAPGAKKQPTVPGSLGGGA